jgi:3-phosphoshikimate 1-carboxyvinyltransferase
MLKLFGADIKIKGKTIVVRGGKELVPPGKLYIPGDISSAAFFLIPAAIIPGSRVLIRKASLNPSRTGAIKVLERMGADIQVSHQVTKTEPMGDILVRSSPLRGTVIRKEEIPSLIDEIPILMVAACFACGRTIFEGVGELRVKETDRIRSMSENLKKMGADISLSKVNAVERIIIKGVKHLEGTEVRSFGLP